MSDDADLYRPTEEHEAFRAAVREVCTDKVAPNAAEADELGEFPKASYEALRAADFHAPHIPEAYGGVGADALATVIVIEEIARACASSSLIPAVNKLASLPWLLAGRRGSEAALPAADRRRRGDGLLLSLRAGRRLRRRQHEDPGGSGRGRLGPERGQALDHQRRGLRLLHRLRRHRPRRPLEGHQRLRGGEDRRRGQLRRPGEEARHQGLTDPGGLPRCRTDPRRPADRRRGHRFRHRDAHPRPHPGHHRRTGGRHRPGGVGLRARLRARSASSSARRSRSSRGSSSCSPTWA